MRHRVRGCLVILALTAPALQASSSPQDVPAATRDAATLAEHIAALGAFDHAARTRAARLIRRAPAADAAPLLAAAARAHEDGFVRFRSLVLLTGFNDRGTAALMRELMADPDDRVREVAYRWFERHPDPALREILVAALQRESAEFVRPALVSALAALGDDPQVQRTLIVEIGRGMDMFRGAVIDMLGRHRAAYAVDAIGGVARGPGPLQYDAVVALARIGDARAAAALDAIVSAPPDVQLARTTALCLTASRCETHLADALRVASRPDATRTVMRAAVTALVTAALEGEDLRALAVLYELSAAGELARIEAARGFGVFALRAPAALTGWLERIPDEARAPAMELVADGVGRLEEPFLEEQLFVALRAAYWRAPDGSTAREMASALIDTLEF